ncbi:MAG: hypothetical protein HUU49_01620 [Candidatus Buchananbacteria bacterium]|nr:hypothetical protein [Candidatus Buchananbacteria bacterium]
MENQRLKKMKKESGAEDLNVQKGLMKIYSNSDGSLPDISHLEVRRKGRWRMLFLSFLGITLLLAAISWLGFLVFNPTTGVGTQSIKLEIKGEQNISSGDELTYVLEYKNIEDVTLHNVELIFRYPEGFEFISSEPKAANEFNTSWALGDLAKNQSGKIEIKGKMIGEVGSIKNISVTASFNPENFSSTFKESASFSSQITSSILNITLEGPDKILPEKKTTYKIKYRNDSDQDLENIKILVTYPSNFLFQEATPAAFHREEDARNLNNQWVIEKLEKNQEGEIEISGGYLKDQTITNAEFKAQIGFLDPETEAFSLQQEQIITTQIIDSGLSLNLIINGSNQSQPINFGQTLTYSLVYKNLGQEDLDDVSFSVTLDSDILDWESLSDLNNGLIEGNTITWNKDQISQFDLIRPLDEGTIDFSIDIKAADSVNIKNADLQITSTAKATMVKIGEVEVPDFEVVAPEINNNINTDIQLNVAGRYFDEDNIAVGTGPLPPAVGQKTTFRIYWSIANSLHEVKDVTVTTSLPDGVIWENKFLARAGEVDFTQSGNTVTWSIDRIPPNKGFEDVNFWFDVSVTPTKQQAKKLIILTDQTVLQATDQATDSIIIKNAKAITSNLEDDPIGGGRGLVIDLTQ